MIKKKKGKKILCSQILGDFQETNYMSEVRRLMEV